jgi:hypothetical protein
MSGIIAQSSGTPEKTESNKDFSSWGLEKDVEASIQSAGITPTVDREEYKEVLRIKLLNGTYYDHWRLAELSQEFKRHDYVKLPSLLSHHAFSLVCNEVERLQSFAQRRDFLMPGVDTPRIMMTVGGRRLSSSSSMLANLSVHHQLWNVVGRIVDAPIFPCRHPEEFMVLNYLVAPGNTHGWHLDDPAYALIMFIDSPQKSEDGGLLEYIPNWLELYESRTDNAEVNPKDMIDFARREGFIKTRHHNKGDAYLLRADRCFHRVTPLTATNVRRVVINVAYEASPETAYGSTASTLYSETSR